MVDRPRPADGSLTSALRCPEWRSTSGEGRREARATSDVGALVPTRVEPARPGRRPAPVDRRVPQPRRRSQEPDPGRGRPWGALHRRPARLRLPAHHGRTDQAADAVPADEEKHRAARDSRLVYALPPGTPYALMTILGLGARALELDDRALGDSVDTGEPAPNVTALKDRRLPRLHAQPRRPVRRRPGPDRHDDVAQLWRAQMIRRGRAPAGSCDLVPPRRHPFDRQLPADDQQRIVTATHPSTQPDPQVDRLADHPGSVLDLPASRAQPVDSGSAGGWDGLCRQRPRPAIAPGQPLALRASPFLVSMSEMWPLPPLIGMLQGRDVETLPARTRWLTELRDGRGRSLLLRGEPGIGKTPCSTSWCAAAVTT